MAILGIDPGTRKCGFAVIVGSGEPPLALGIEATENLRERVRDLAARFELAAVALGGGTHTAAVAQMLTGIGVPVHIVDERETTLRARARYFASYPPRGWRRLIPRGLLLPPRPIDDFAATLIAERLIAQGLLGKPGSCAGA